MSSEEIFDVIVIGGGQAGLAAGYFLSRGGKNYVILDENTRPGETWRKRWDNLRLFTPSQNNSLPGMKFPKPDSGADYCRGSDSLGRANQPYFGGCIYADYWQQKYGGGKMNKVWLVLRKELKEIVQPRTLVMALLVVPLLIIVANGYLLKNPQSAGSIPVPTTDPRIAGLTTREVAQLAIGNMFRMYLLAQPLLIPAMIAAYSIVGEKNNRTLEPLLAAPVSTWQLLLAKSISAMLPALFVTWISGGVFIAEIAGLSSPTVFASVVTPGWLIIMILTVPVFMLIPIAVTVMISSRFNDPRTTSQVASLIFVILVLAFTIFGSNLVISPLNSLVITAILAFLGLALLWSATKVFQRENILTRWS
jgi:ABC-2 type transport system permease protein